MNAHINGRNVTVVATGADTPELRAAMRKAACGEAHTATIGKLLKVNATGEGGPGATLALTWGPVTTRSGAARPAAAKAAPKAAPAASVSDLVAMEIAELRARLAELTGEATPAPAKARETFAPIAKAAARKAAAACGTCMDLGHVRKVARENGSVAYRTAKGRDASIALGNATACTAKGCKAGKAARKAA